MTARALVQAGVAALCVSPLPLAAQAAARRPSPFCLRGHPLRACRSYLVFEVTGAKGVISTSHQVFLDPAIPVFTEADIGSYLAWTVGGMVNRDSTHALGATLQAGLISEGVRAALQGRSRKWVTDDAAFDVAVGILSTPQNAAHVGTATAYGLTGESAFGVGDQVSAFVSGDLVRSRSHTSAALHVGGRVGSYTAMVATALMGVIVLTITSQANRFD
jgi:hypothetical protein